MKRLTQAFWSLTIPSVLILLPCKLAASPVTFDVISEAKTIRFPNEPEEFATHLTDVRMVLKTDSTASIQDFVVVQWIRGCQFESTWDPSGKETKTLSLSRRHFGKLVPFIHREWEIDSDIADPAYSADSRFGRFALFRWNKNPNSLEPRTSTYYYRAPPPHPTVFLTDLPGSASYFKDKQTGFESARSSSLEFRTCLYRSSEVPLVSDPLGSNFKNTTPIKCLTWHHKYLYDHKLRTFLTSGPIDPICI